MLLHRQKEGVGEKEPLLPRISKRADLESQHEDGPPRRRDSSSDDSSSDGGKKADSDDGYDLEDMEKLPYPKCVFFILCTEACERFSFYGMRAILSLYLKHLFVQDGMPADEAEDLATILYHTFNFLCYFTSLFGAFLADSFLGKFRTIFYISIVYVIGQATLSFGAVPGENIGWENFPQDIISYVGLILIAIGTGGIKPCVVSFGADQFTLPQQKAEMSTFFGIFYASINFGSMISTILTPIFRKQSCLGEDECYTLAFGVPAALMLVAVIFFVLGRPWYKITVPEINIVLEFCKAMIEAVKQKSKSNEKRDHWMDYAAERYGKSFVSDIKAVLSVCVIFTMYPVFWALYDQQGSRWTFQAEKMDGQIGGFYLLPDQMQVVNAALILIYIPIFDKGVYPLCNRFGLLTTPLQKIITGGCLVGFAFVISAVVEIFLEDTYPIPPGVDEARINYHNGLPLDSSCTVNVQYDDVPGYTTALPDSIVRVGQSVRLENEDGDPVAPFGVEDGVGLTIRVTASVDTTECSIVNNRPAYSFDIDLESQNGTNVFFYADKESLQAYVSKYTDEADTSETGYPWMRPIYFMPGINKDALIVVSSEDYDPNDPDADDGEISAEIHLADSVPVNDLGGVECDKMGELRVCIQNFMGMEEELCGTDSSGSIVYTDFRFGGSYDFYMQYEGDGSEANPYILRVDVEEVIEPNSVHMLWLLPQYMVLTAGEVLFSITSLAFSFTQAPESMKAVLQALYLLTTAMGDLLDVVVISLMSDIFSSQAYEFLLFAAIMFLDMGGLILLAMRYEYVDYTDMSPGGAGFKGDDRSSMASSIEDVKGGGVLDRRDSNRSSVRSD